MSYQESSHLHSEISHPVVRTHPGSGKKALYVNSMFTLRFEGMTEAESAPLLQYLTALPNRPEVQCRFRWRPGSIAIWDNRICQHIAIGDGAHTRRRMQRITVTGERPI
jgi:taurine dioxygenase